MKLEGKIALITGGGGGIGGGIARAFAEKGMKLVLADINVVHAQEQAAEFGENAIAVALDVTSLASWAMARKLAHDRFGTVDVLCNNAGISMPREPLDKVPPERFARVMAINVTGVYNGVVTFAEDMRQRRSGHIVNTSSMNGLLAFGTFAAYSASKFAVTGLSEALRDELAPFGVGVSIVFPGLTRSRMSLADIATGDIPRDIAEQGDDGADLARPCSREGRRRKSAVRHNASRLPPLPRRALPQRTRSVRGVRAARLHRRMSAKAGEAVDLTRNARQRHLIDRLVKQIVRSFNIRSPSGQGLIRSRAEHEAARPRVGSR